MTLSELAARCEGNLLGLDAAFDGFVTDSRAAGTGKVFLAIRGAKVDGHDYAMTALNQGASGVMGDRIAPGVTLLVEDLAPALAKFGLSLRREFSGPVVAVTGSAGKTSAKEFTAAALAGLGPVLKSEGNRNTEFTSPLTWFDLAPDHRSVVVELGMRGFGQIAHLTAAHEPTIGIITGIGTAHIEMVGSREGIARAKGELLFGMAAEGTAILWQEDDFLAELKEMARGEVLTFGDSPEADLRIVGVRAMDWSGSVARFEFRGQSAEAKLPALGRHQARNAAAGVLAAVAAGLDFESAVEGLAKTQLPPMRMEAREVGGATLLLDNYNASPDSTVAALKTLAEGPVAGRRIAVLGEMKELGDFESRGHELVGEALAASAVDLAYLCGGPTRHIGKEARRRGYPDSQIVEREVLHHDDLRNFLTEFVKPGDVVLIKGSRSLELERGLPEGWNA